MLPTSMLAMAADPTARRLIAVRRPLPAVGEYDVLLKVLACGVCRTDLHIIDGELPPRREAVVPGHEVVGQVVAAGAKATRFAIGERVGVPWLGGTCGRCPYCTAMHENLCDNALFTGYDRDGGFAEYAAADERFCFALPRAYDDAHAAPLLCAGLIGFRAWRLAGAARSTARPVRLRRGGPHHLPGGRGTGPGGVCLHPPGRRKRAGVRAQPGRGLGGSLQRTRHRSCSTRP